MFVEYKKFFFLYFYFLAQIQWAKKSNGLLKRKVAYVTIYHIFKKIKKKMAGVWKIHWNNGLFSRRFLGQ